MFISVQQLVLGWHGCISRIGSSMCAGVIIAEVHGHCIVFMMSGFFDSSDGQKVCRSCRRSRNLGLRQG